MKRREHEIERFKEWIAEEAASASGKLTKALAKMGEGNVAVSFEYEVRWGHGVVEAIACQYLAEMAEHIAKLEAGQLAGAKTFEALSDYYIGTLTDHAMRREHSTSMFANAVSESRAEVARSLRERWMTFRDALAYADRDDAQLAAEAACGIERKTLREMIARASDATAAQETRTMARKVLAQMRAKLREHAVPEKFAHGSFWVSRDGAVLGFMPKDELVFQTPVPSSCEVAIGQGES